MLTNLEPDVRNRVNCFLQITTRMIRVKRRMMMKRRTRTTKRKRRRMSRRKRKETPYLYFSELYSTDFFTALNMLRAMFLRVLFRPILRHYKVTYSTKFLW